MEGDRAGSAAAVSPPVAPMLATLARELPGGEVLYEPKWDGFRCLAFRSPGAVELRSRHDRPLGRYFPELVEALSRLTAPAVLDGEIVIPAPGGFDFSALLTRLHPAASRVERLRHETPARYIAFDLLAVGSEDLRERPFTERRAALRELLADSPPPLHLSPSTDDPALARRWLELDGGGVDGVVVKDRDQPYRPGARAMVKVKREHTVDCVVAGFRFWGETPVVGSLLLGLYDDAAELRHVGVCSAFSNTRRHELLSELRPYLSELEGHPWERGFLLGGGPTGRLRGAAGRWDAAEMELDWVPLRPELVCEVACDHVDVDRFRHPAAFRRWRPDRDARSCLLKQLQPPSVEALELLAAS